MLRTGETGLRPVHDVFEVRGVSAVVAATSRVSEVVPSARASPGTTRGLRHSEVTKREVVKKQKSFRTRRAGY